MVYGFRPNHHHRVNRSLNLKVLTGGSFQMMWRTLIFLITNIYLSLLLEQVAFRFYLINECVETRK